jgi:hypothetical protein
VPAPNESAKPPQAATSVANAHIKGSLLKPFFLWYTAEGGQERTARLLDHMPPALLPLFDPRSPDIGILDATWYPAQAVHVLCDALLVDRTPLQRTQLAQASARVSMTATLKGVYRWLFDVIMTPQRYADRAQMLFSRFFDTGVIAKTETAPNTHLTVIRGWASHHPHLCELVLHSSVAVYEAMGCRHVVSKRLGCVSDGAAECSYTVTWTDP